MRRLFTIETEDTSAGHLLDFLNHESLGDTRDGPGWTYMLNFRKDWNSDWLYPFITFEGAEWWRSSAGFISWSGASSQCHQSDSLACWVFNFAKPIPSSSKDMKSWGKKHKLPQKRCVSVFLPSYGSFVTRGPLQQRHDALLLPDKTSKAKKLHGLLQNATNALCLLLCLTFCLGQEQPMQYEIHSTCVLYTWRYCNSVFVINDSWT